MYGFREGSCRRATCGGQRAPLGKMAFWLLTAAGLSGASAACAPGLQGRAGGGIGALSLANPASFETSYVSLLDAPAELPVIDVSAGLKRPSEVPRAAAYARRYGISPELALDIVEHALAEGLDPALAFRLVHVESRFKVTARGPQGARGLTQLMPGTARAIDRSVDTERELLDPDTNLRTGFRYLRRMIDRYDDVRLGLLAYNRGPNAVDRALRRGQDPENGYSHKVLGTRSSRPYAGPGRVDGFEAESEG